MPYLYLITVWGGLIPPAALEGRQLGSRIFLDHIGFTSTIIAFYLLPLLLFKNERFEILIKNFLFNKRNWYGHSLLIN